MRHPPVAVPVPTPLHMYFYDGLLHVIRIVMKVFSHRLEAEQLQSLHIHACRVL